MDEALDKPEEPYGLELCEDYELSDYDEQSLVASLPWRVNYSAQQFVDFARVRNLRYRDILVLLAGLVRIGIDVVGTVQTMEDDRADLYAEAREQLFLQLLDELEDRFPGLIEAFIGTADVREYHALLREPEDIPYEGDSRPYSSE